MSEGAHTVKTAGVVGAGVIGASWAALFLSRGLKVVVSDPVEGAEGRLHDYIKQAWPTLQELNTSDGRDKQGQDAIRENLTFVASLEDMFSGHSIDYVQENTPERLPLKIDLFKRLDSLAGPNVPLASSSSGLTASQYLDECSHHPERVLVAHPFNPPHMIQGVEVVPHPGTSEAAIATTMQFLTSLDRRPVKVLKETPGFIGNRLQAALVYEAYSLVARGCISAADVDTLVADTMAMRWAIQGVFKTKVLGGGGGLDGFHKQRDHLGPASMKWIEDMRAHQWEDTPEEEERLRKSVDEQLQQMSSEEANGLAAERDAFLLEALKAKQRIAK